MSEESVAGRFVDEEELLVFQGEADEIDDLCHLLLLSKLLHFMLCTLNFAF